MSVDGTGWDTTEDRQTTANNTVLSGEGGSDLKALGQGRAERVALFSRAQRNATSYEMPAGVSGAGWDRSPVESESQTGVQFSGSFLDESGNLMTGTARIVIGDPEDTTTVSWGGSSLTFGGVAASDTVTGPFSITAPPPQPVIGGDNADVFNQTFSLEFLPATPAVAFQQEVNEFRTSIGINQYGAAFGKITDHEGDPVPGVGVAAQGTGTNSREDGSFKLLGPTGETLPIETLYGTLDTTITFQIDADRDNPQIFQFPAMTFEVVDAEYEPVDSAPVVVDAQTYYTGEDGTVSLSPVGLGDYGVTVMNKFEGEVSVEEEGVNYHFRLGPDSTIVDWEPDPADSIGGVKLRALDVQSGIEIRGVAASVPEQGVVSESGVDGVVKLLTTEVGDKGVTVQLASGDKRYNPSEFIIDEMPDGQMIEAEVNLRRKDQVVNT